MMKHTFRHPALALVLAVTCVLTGCGRNTHQAPPKQQVRDAVAGELPPFLSLVNLELEPVATGPESVKVNFKASVEAEEDLYQVAREVAGPSKVMLLKRVQAGGAQCVLYGFLETQRFMDQWTLGTPQFQKRPDPFGKPRGAFGAHAYVAGSVEAEAAVRQQAVAMEQAQQIQQVTLEEQERARIAREEVQVREAKARRAQLEQARIAFEEQGRQESEQRKQADAQRQQAAAAVRQQLLLATAPGTRYLGTKTGVNSSVQRLCLAFTDQQDTLLRAEVNNPDDASEKRTFTGELRFNAQPEGGRAVAYTIVMHGLRTNKLNPDRNSIYERSIVLKLQLSDHGLEGVADAGLGEQFPLRLQREGTSSATTPGFTAPQPGPAAKKQVP